MKRAPVEISCVEERYEVEITRDLATGVAIYEKWLVAGKPHHENCPAMLRRDRVTGVVVWEAWCKNGIPHREDGPAVICRKADTGRIFRSEWLVEGKRISAPKGKSSSLAIRPGPKAHRDRSKEPHA